MSDKPEVTYCEALYLLKHIDNSSAALEGEADYLADMFASRSLDSEDLTVAAEKVLSQVVAHSALCSIGKATIDRYINQLRSNEANQ